MINKLKKHVRWMSALFVASLLFGCGNGKQKESDGLITVDVSKSYPKKELILQDLFDIEYVPLETTDDFMTTRWILDITAHYVVTMNMREGELFFFDRATGKGIRRICRKGEGPEEYLHVSGAVVDEVRSELFVNDGMRHRIVVYDLEGNYRRDFKFREDAIIQSIYNYDSEYLLCADTYAIGNLDSEFTYFLISKDNGNVKAINIPYKERISNCVWKIVSDDFVYASTTGNNQIIPYGNEWYLMEPSADTVYALQKDLSIKPFLVRMPSVQEMDPVVFLFPSILTDDYCFMQVVEKIWDFNANKGFPRKDLVYDRQEGMTYECVLHNADYEELEISFQVKAFTAEVPFQIGLEPADLIEALNDGKLRGPLKEIASRLDEEDNPVILIAKYKK